MQMFRLEVGGSGEALKLQNKGSLITGSSGGGREKGRLMTMGEMAPPSQGRIDGN